MPLEKKEAVEEETDQAEPTELDLAPGVGRGAGGDEAPVFSLNSLLVPDFLLQVWPGSIIDKMICGLSGGHAHLP